MSISYKGIIGHTARATLPSVETWGANMNILRDPPKSIFTRQIDKVGETSEITQMIQESGDRVNEVIQVYARGVNPMVAVSYDNYGNNGGQRIGVNGLVNGSVNSGRQSYLPYRVLDKGAFRPPMRDQRELLPLSRLPRVWTSSFTNASFPDFSKKAMCPTPVDTRSVKPDMLKACARPTVTYKLETPIIENYEVKRIIKNPIKISGDSRKEGQGKFNGEIGDPVKNIVENPLKPDFNLNTSTISQNIDVSNFNTEKYTQNVLHSNVSSNVSQNHYVTPIEEIYQERGTKSQINIDYTTPITSFEKYDYMHAEPVLERSIPVYEANTNMGISIHKDIERIPERTYTMNRPTPSVMTNATSQGQRFEGSRDYNLKPTINSTVNQYGGYNPSHGMPQQFHQNMEYHLDSKDQMRRRVYDMRQQRDTTSYEFQSE